MKTRKIVLITANLLLLVIGIIQIIQGARSTVKTFTFSEEPDKIVIEKIDGNLSIVKDGDKWFINDQKYEATQSYIDTMISLAKNIKALDRVASLSNAASVSKYELDETNAIKVTVSSASKELRTFMLGKDSTTGIQCYATINGTNDIYLVNGDYRQAFDKTVDQVRSKTIYTVDAVDISSVSITSADQSTWTVSRQGDAGNLVWNISGADITLDSEKAADWLNSFASLTTTKWYGTTDNLGGEPFIKAEIGTTAKKIKIDIYTVTEDPEDSSSKQYYAKCSESPYWFELPSYNMSKFQKTPEDLQR